MFRQQLFQRVLIVMTILVTLVALAFILIATLTAAASGLLLTMTPSATTLTEATRSPTPPLPTAPAHARPATELASYPHNGPVAGAVWNHDETRLLTWSMDGTAKIWNMASGAELATLAHGAPVRGAAWNHDETQVLTWSAARPDCGADCAFVARLWAVDAPATPQLTLTQPDNPRVLESGAALWSPDERWIVTWTRAGEAYIWDAATGTLRLIVQHTSVIWGAAWNHDSSALLTWSTDETARVWDVAAALARADEEVPIRNQALLTLRHSHVVWGAAWNGDETRILTWGLDNIAQVWDAFDGRPLLTLVHGDYVWQAAWSQDYRRVLTASFDGAGRIWEVGNLSPEVFGISRTMPLVTLPHESAVFGAVFSPREDLVVTYNGQGFAVWEAATGQQWAWVATPTTSVAWHPGGESLITWSTGIEGATVWDSLTGAALLSLPHPGVVQGARWSEHGRRIVTWGEDGWARLWQLGEPTGPTPTTPPVSPTYDSASPSPTAVPVLPTTAAPAATRTPVSPSALPTEVSPSPTALPSSTPIATQTAPPATPGASPSATPEGPPTLFLPTFTPESLAGTTAQVGVVRWNGEPVAGITMTLMRNGCFGEGTGAVAEVVTGPDGVYRFENLSPGTYVTGTNGWNGGAVEPYMTSCSGRPYAIAAGETRQHDIDLIKQDLMVTAPLSGAVESSTPIFSWEPYPGAVYYELSVFRRTPAFEQTIYGAVSYESQLLAPTPLTPGHTYDGWIYAYNGAGVAIATGDIPLFRVDETQVGPTFETSFRQSVALPAGLVARQSFIPTDATLYTVDVALRIHDDGQTGGDVLALRILDRNERKVVWVEQFVPAEFAGWLRITLPEPVTLQAGASYWLELEGSRRSARHGWAFQDNVYADGVMFAAHRWRLHNDFGFRLNAGEPATSVPHVTLTPTPPLAPTQTPTPLPPPATATYEAQFQYAEIYARNQELTTAGLGIQVAVGESVQLFVARLECCYYFAEVAVAFTWSVAGSPTVQIDPASGLLTVAAETAPQVLRVMATAPGGYTITGLVRVYDPAALPFIGVWREQAQLDCATQTWMPPTTPIAELVFSAAGAMQVTWFPFEVYIDYFATYTYDASSGAFAFSVQWGNYLPAHLDTDGRLTLDEEGRLVLADLWLGAGPTGEGRAVGCGHRFVRA